jgi:hypothetical protein
MEYMTAALTINLSASGLNPTRPPHHVATSKSREIETDVEMHKDVAQRKVTIFFSR